MIMGKLLNFWKSKINWAAIVLVITGLLPLIEQHNFDGMTAKDWVVFSLGVIVFILRTYMTNTANKFAVIALPLLFTFSSCTSTQKSISAKNSLERILNYAKEKGDASVKKESNGAITTTVKFKDFYNPEKVKEKFRKFIAVFNATEPSVTITATTQDSTIVIPQLPSFKK